MWLCFNNAFLSIVNNPKDPTTLIVRARREGDIQAIFPDVEVIQTIGRDYLYRAFIDREIVGQALAQKAASIDYNNFKGSVINNLLHDAYMAVWGTMAKLQAIPPYSKGDPFTHPKLTEYGHKVKINQPSKESHKSNWTNPEQAATAVPAGNNLPEKLNGIAFKSCKNDWSNGHGDFDEPTFTKKPGKKISAGVIIKESDGRIWLVAPTNQFGGYSATFPKGTVEAELGFRATAIKEAFEEAGLQVELVGYATDSIRSTSVTRYYFGKRIGGTPVDMGWESQAVHLVPVHQLSKYLTNQNDVPLIEFIVANCVMFD